jgi:hypothetical protein
VFTRDAIDGRCVTDNEKSQDPEYPIATTNNDKNKRGKLTMMFAVAAKTLPQITMVRRVTTGLFAAASEKVRKAYLSGT